MVQFCDLLLQGKAKCSGNYEEEEDEEDESDDGIPTAEIQGKAIETAADVLVLLAKLTGVLFHPFADTILAIFLRGLIPRSPVWLRSVSVGSIASITQALGPAATPYAETLLQVELK